MPPPAFWVASVTLKRLAQARAAGARDPGDPQVGTDRDGEEGAVVPFLGLGDRAVAVGPPQEVVEAQA